MVLGSSPRGVTQPSHYEGMSENTITRKVGQFLVETLVTDTVAYEIVKVTDKTMTVRYCGHSGERIGERDVDGPWPVVYSKITSEPNGPLFKVGLRKDGTYRVGTHPLRDAPVHDGVPFTVTDYRF